MKDRRRQFVNSTPRDIKNETQNLCAIT